MTAIEKMVEWIEWRGDRGDEADLREVISKAKELAAEEKSKPAPVEANKCKKCAIRNPGRPDRKTGNCHKCFFQDSWTWDREEYCSPSNCPRLTGNFHCEEKL